MLFRISAVYKFISASHINQSTNHLPIFHPYNQSRSSPGAEVDGKVRQSESVYSENILIPVKKQNKTHPVHSFLFATIRIPTEECQTVNFALS